MSLHRTFALAVFMMGLALTGPALAEQAAEFPQSAHGRPSAPLAARNGVARGERVAVEVTSGAARLAFESTAESTGSLGNFILVRNPANGRLFPAKVTGKGKVVVQR